MNYAEKIKDKMNTLLQVSSTTDNQKLYIQLCQFETSTQIQTLFNRFFSEHNLYFIQTSELYIHYHQHQYHVLTENDVIHLILKNLSLYPLNTPLKQQIKSKIQKKIKERSIYNVIPDSVTLQEMISFLHPLLFETKNGAKYFMTILGDTIMKKNNHYYFLDPTMKPLIQKIQKMVSLYLCSNQLSNFKFKYCDHNPQVSRIVKTNNINMNYLRFDESLYLNLIACSIHYSNRFQNGDLFLEDITNQTLRQDVLWIKEANKEVVLQDFVYSYFYPSETDIHEKDVLFLWKLYLKEKNRVNIFQKNIQEDLSRIMMYQPPYFKYMNSMRMPYVKKFTQFWQKNIYEDKNEQLLELTEILSLFMEHYPKFTDMNEHHIKDMIQYYYPDTVIDHRCVHQKGCLLWNKKEELQQFIDTTSYVEDLYQAYLDSPIPRKVSKQYFKTFTENINTNL
jgi:hypothetical protein